MIRIPGTIPIRIHPIFWLTAVLIGGLSANFDPIRTMMWIGIIFCSVLAHEFGHALTALFFSQRAQIDLVAFGGVTQRMGPKIAKWKEFVIVLNGPIAGFAFGFAALALRQFLGAPYRGTLLGYTLEVTFLVNMFWTVINLLPITPMDGGKLFTIVLEAIFGVKGLKISLFISFVLAGVIGIIFFLTQNFLIGAIFMMLAFESYRIWKDSLSMTRQDQSDELKGEYERAELSYRFGRADEAIEQFEMVREKAKGGVLYTAATEKLALIYFQRGEYKKAYDLLQPIKKGLGREASELYQQLAFKNNYFEEAIQVGTKLFQTQPDYQIALLNAESHALLDQEVPALGWLNSAIREGLPNVQETLSQNAFDPIRQTDKFKELQNRYRA